MHQLLEMSPIAKSVHSRARTYERDIPCDLVDETIEKPTRKQRTLGPGKNGGVPWRYEKDLKDKRTVVVILEILKKGKGATLDSDSSDVIVVTTFWKN